MKKLYLISLLLLACSITYGQVHSFPAASAEGLWANHIFDVTHSISFDKESQMAKDVLGALDLKTLTGYIGYSAYSNLDLMGAINRNVNTLRGVNARAITPWSRMEGDGGTIGYMRGYMVEDIALAILVFDNYLMIWDVNKTQ